MKSLLFRVPILSSKFMPLEDICKLINSSLWKHGASTTTLNLILTNCRNATTSAKIMVGGFDVESMEVRSTEEIEQKFAEDELFRTLTDAGYTADDVESLLRSSTNFVKYGEVDMLLAIASRMRSDRIQKLNEMVCRVLDKS